MSADALTVLKLAERVEQWPQVLAHYQRVAVLAHRPEGRIVEMSAFRAGVPLPVRWRAIQRIDADTSRVIYRHI
ncbi:MAG TPA: hypothetical protein VHB98_23815, partial [Chloroflexota bacterium]|nr:hypothetical protein [Chloroflexota bacterium]